MLDPTSTHHLPDVMDGGDFIKLAGMIVGYGEAGARSATSRAYCGAFHLALDLLDDFDCGPPRNGKAHALAPEFLRCSRQESAREAGRLLAHLHSRRLYADYELADSAPEQLIFGQQSVESADAIRGLLRDFRAVCEERSEVEAELRREVARIREIRKLPP